MNEIASKTFASQFLSPESTVFADPFERLIFAVKNNRVDILSAASRDLLTQKDANGKNLLFYAVYQKSPQILLFLLRSCLPVNESDKQQKNLYHFCGYSGSIQCLQTLNTFIKLINLMELNKKFISQLQKYNYKRTDAKNGKLKYSVSPKRMEIFASMQAELTELYRNYVISYLEEHTLKPLGEVDEAYQRNPFHLVCLNKYQKCFSTLEEFVQQINQPDLLLGEKTVADYVASDAFFAQKLDPRLCSDTLSLLSHFILPEQLHKIHKEYEIKAKKGLQAVLTANDKDGFTPLYLASRNGSTAMINLLKKYDPHPKSEQRDQIMKAASNNLARSHIIDLCQAAKLPDIKPLSFLLSCGEEINEKKTIFGTFALLESIKSFSTDNTLEPIKKLLKNGADINEQDTNGWTVLHHACHLGLKPVVELLITDQKETGIDLNKTTNKRYHCLHLAAMSNHPEIIEILIGEQCKVDVNVRDWDGSTALLHAAKKDSLKSLQVLLDGGADLYAVDKFLMTALHHAAFHSSFSCLKELLVRDGDWDKLITMRNSKGKLAKDLCSNTGAFENIFTAVRTDNVNIIRKSIAANSSIKDSVTPAKERTPLIIAVMSKSLASVRFLIDSGADTYHEDKDGKSASQYCEEALTVAKQSKNKEQIKLLQQMKMVIDG